jgi:predicted membrane protein (TIGR00267 family)
MTVSGVWGAYITERAERCGEVKKLERATSLTLKDGPIEKAHKFASIFLALINGLSPIIIAFIILIPVLLVPAFSVMLAYQMSMAIAFITLFVLGASLGRISKENVLICGVEMLLTGVACVIILFLLGV